MPDTVSSEPLDDGYGDPYSVTVNIAPAPAALAAPAEPGVVVETSGYGIAEEEVPEARVLPIAPPLTSPAAVPIAVEVPVPKPTARVIAGPFLLEVEEDLFGVLPVFFLNGTGDLRTLALQTGLEFDRARQRFRAPTPYHARLLWCYADEKADAALKKLFPRLERPARPRHVPFVMATNDRIICLTSANSQQRPHDAGFVFNSKGHYWETRDLRRVLPLIDIAEEELQKRLSAIAGLPFDSLADIQIKDLLLLSKSEGGGGGAAPKEETEAGKGAVLEYDLERRLYVCRDPAAQGAGFIPLRKNEYVSNDFEQAQQLRVFANDKAELRLQAEAMVRTIPDPYTPDPRPVPQSPLAPYPFGVDQLDGIRFMATRRGSLVADEMGVGKTAQALGLINVERPRLALILVPANLQDNWMQECAAYLAPPNVAAIFGRDSNRDSLPVGANVVIASYDMLPKLLLLHRLAPDILICDEAQEIKSEETKAGRIIYNLIAPASGKMVFMTGTPIWNRPQDLWAPLHAIAPDVFPYKKNFLRLYRVSDPENVSEWQDLTLDFLAHLLKSGLMIRRLKDDVLDLPEKKHNLVSVTLPDDVLARLQEIDQKVEETEAEVNEASGKEAAAKRRTLFSELARLRREVGEAKYEFVRDRAIEFIRAHPPTMERPRPLVVFGRHRELLTKFSEDLARIGGNPVLLTGKASTTARQKRVNEFQAGKAGSAVASFDAAGVGYTMTRACDIFIFEVDYTPALMKQAIDRIHRRGQDRVCNVYWFVVEGTIDARIAKLFVKKDEIAQSALGDHLVGMFSAEALATHQIHFADPEAMAA